MVVLRRKSRRDNHREATRAKPEQRLEQRGFSVIELDYDRVKPVRINEPSDEPRRYDALTSA